MPATIPNSFTSGTNIEAESLDENVRAVRNYLNGSVTASDIDSDTIDQSSVVAGTFIGANQSHWFATGEIVGGRAGGQAWERTYFTGQAKQSDDYTTTTLYVPISGTGAQLELEADATIFVHGYFQMVVPEGTLNGNTVGKDHIAYYVIDSAIPSSYALAFTEGATASANSGAVQGETPNNRRSFPVSYTDDLTAGTHNLFLQINLDEQQAYVSAYSWYIEIFYK